VAFLSGRLLDQPFRHPRRFPQQCLVPWLTGGMRRSL